MTFKELRQLIFCQCKVIVADKIYENIYTHTSTQFDEYIVEGIRARDKIINGYNAGAYIEVLCKKF